MASFSTYRSSILTPQRNYSAYVLDQSNRAIGSGRVTRLIESAETLYLFDLYPLVSTTERVLLDGQHRLEAVRNLLKPFYVISGDDIQVADIAEANANTRQYTNEESLHFYAGMGVPSYEFVVRFLRRNPHVGLSRAIRLLGIEHRSFFGNGRFVVGRPKYAQLVADRLRDFSSIHKWVASSVYFHAIANLAHNPAYDHARMMNRLEIVPKRLLHATSLEDCFACINEVYNFNMVQAKRIDLKPLTPSWVSARFDWSGETRIEGQELPIRGIAHNRQIELRETHDLSMFRQHPHARQVNEHHLQALIGFMGRRNLLPYYPILVDKNHTILDGQKRWLAANELHLPISYIVSDNFSLHMAAIAAGTASNWALDDYLKHYAARGYSSYVQLQHFRQDYPQVGLVLAIIIASDRYQRATEPFKLGQFEAKQMGFLRTVGRAICKIADVRLRRLDTVQYALYKIAQSHRFDLDLLVQRINANHSQIGPFATIDQCVDELLNAYNYRLSENKRMRLDSPQERLVAVGA